MKKSIVTLPMAILAVCLPGLMGASQPGLDIHDADNGAMAIVAGHCTPQANVVLQTTTDFSNWMSIATNTATLNDVATFYIPKTNSKAFFRVYPVSKASVAGYAISSQGAGQVSSSVNSSAPQSSRSQSSSAASTSSSAAKSSPADCLIVSAVYGSGVHYADVTERVNELLRQPGTEFYAHPQWLHADPTPYWNKALVIIYEVKGQRHIFTTGEGGGVSLEQLIQSATQKDA